MGSDIVKTLFIDTHNEMITDWHKDIITIVKDDKKISHLHLNEKL